MKKLFFAAAILFSCLTVQIAKAQVSVSLNIGSQPDWGPTGYDRADYYYMPDIDTYYDVNNHVYVYNEGGVWVHRTYLPARYQSFDRYHAYKAVVNERNPWERNNVYRAKYISYRGRTDQAIIRDSHDARYLKHYRAEVVRNHNRNVAIRNHKIHRHNVIVNRKNIQTEKRIEKAEEERH